jgi:uncharacterized membrane protein YgcG
MVGPSLASSRHHSFIFGSSFFEREKRKRKHHPHIHRHIHTLVLFSHPHHHYAIASLVVSILHSIMDQLLQLAQQAGMTDSQGKTAMGGIFQLLQSNVSSQDFAQIETAVPGAASAAAAANTTTTNSKNDPTSQLMNSAMGMFGGSGGGGGGGSSSGGGTTPVNSLPQLLQFATQSGIDVKQIMALLPMVIQFLQSHANVDVSSILGGTGGSSPTTTAAPGGGSGNSGSSSLAAQAQGFLGGFMKK